MRRCARRLTRRPLSAGWLPAMRRLLRPSIGADFARRLRNYQRGLRMRCHARHLHRRQRGRRKQHETKFGHVILFPQCHVSRAPDQQIRVRPQCGGDLKAVSIYFCGEKAPQRLRSWPIQALLSMACKM
jgi:hypothetical protein